MTGLEHLPTDGGGVLVSWHPNGMVDPALILTHFPQRVVFGARDGLFRVPMLGWLMRSIGTVPIYRAQDGAGADPESRRTANAGSLDALAGEVLGGSWSCLFPEGDSHDSPHLIELKTGAARFYFRARTLHEDGTPPVIVPVGLHYDKKRAFRSNALVSFHPPLVLPESLDVTPPSEPPDPELHRERCRGLTGVIEQVLREVVHATESWELHHLMHRARKLVRAERADRAGAHLRRPGIRERTLGFNRVWAGYYALRDQDPKRVTGLVDRVREYDSDMRALGLQDHELDRSPRLASPWLGIILLIQLVTVFLLLPPVLVVGYAVNFPPAVALWALAKLGAKKKKDEATIKLFCGALLFPATWLAVGFGAARAAESLHAAYPSIPDAPIMAGLVCVCLAILGGLLTVRYVRLVRETLRGVRVRLTKARRTSMLAHLRVERAELHDAVVGIAEGVELPGTVLPDGRIVSD